MELRQALERAGRALRENAWLHLSAIVTLTLVMVCLAGTLAALSNLERLRLQWGQSRRVSVYLRDGVDPSSVGKMVTALNALPETEKVVHLDAEQARKAFLESTQVRADLAGLDPDIFPASIELTLKPGVSSARVEAIAESAAALAPVSEVETYKSWFGRLNKILSTARALALALALLVAACALAVVGTTIRLSISGRRMEVEILKLCGATNGYVRTPFVFEGALQGFVASSVALLLLFGAFLLARDEIAGTLKMITGVELVFINPLAALSLVLGGTITGALGSSIAVRRYMQV